MPMQEGQLTPEQVIPVGPDQQLWQLALLNDGVGTRVSVRARGVISGVD